MSFVIIAKLSALGTSLLCTFKISIVDNVTCQELDKKQKQFISIKFAIKFIRSLKIIIEVLKA